MSDPATRLNFTPSRATHSYRTYRDHGHDPSETARQVGSHGVRGLDEVTDEPIVARPYTP